MADLGKVIKALECCVFPVFKGFPYQSHIADNGCEVIECPYRDDCDQLLLDALELLKVQEPKPPIVKENAYGWKFFYCPSCGREFNANRKHGCVNAENFCDKCGQAVKWDERT